jgi:NAD(P)-dependent dehydrogenase (short-subunit alcohol dehydrogenase family)
MGQDLAGKVAIITGGANGIGRASVELFVEQGAKVAIADWDEARGQELADRLGPDTIFQKTDVSERDQVQALVDRTVAHFGGLHIMFNNAGIGDGLPADFLTADFGNFDKVARVNLLGVILGSQIAARHMAANGGGSIINTSSIGGTRPGHGVFVYRAVKAGVVNFTQSIAMELGDHLIRVNAICPGNIPTSMAEFRRPEPGMTEADMDRVLAAVNGARMRRQALKRQGSPRDIAEAAVFLGSDRSAQITGLIMPVDAGASAGDPISQLQEINEARAAALAK